MAPEVQLPPRAIDKAPHRAVVSTAASGYVSEDRGCQMTWGRRKARGIMNQIQAAI
jgi:hypothetical protein